MTQPNIIMILADDMGYSDIGSYGGEIATPNLDALAERGIRMTQYYTTPRCSPSRASLLTGRHPHETGIGVLTEDDGPEGYPGSLDPTIPTVAERLREAGYTTCLSGKWHLAADIEEPNASWPTRRGFDEFFGVLAGTVSYYQPRSLMRDEARVDVEPFEDDDYYFTDAITQHAQSFVQRSGDADKPFFLYLSYTAPHWPLHARQEDIDAVAGRFDDGWDVLRERRLQRLAELGLVSSDQALAEDPEVPAWDEVEDERWETRRMEVYAAQVEAMDRGIGRIVDTLEQMGQLDDTLIVFASDNGGCAEELPAGPDSFLATQDTICPPTTRDGRQVRLGNQPGLLPGPEDTYASYGRSWAHLSNTPFRLYKRWVHEGGIASPMLVSWPGGELERGTVLHGMGHIIDLLPTLLDAAGAEIEDPQLTGVSLLPVWRGNREPMAQRTLFWEHIGNAAVRRDQWKLVKEYDLPWELYDMEVDRAETNDLAGQHPDLVAELEREWRAWAQRCGVIPWERMLSIGYYRWAYPPATQGDPN